MRRVCHLSSVHNWYDERIFQKQTKSLAEAGYDVCLIVPREDSVEIDGVRILALPRTAGKFRRLFKADWLLLRAAVHEDAAVYHFHDPELIPFGLLLKALGKRVVYDVHEDYAQTVLSVNWLPLGTRRLVSLVWNRFERISSHFFDRIVVVDSQIRSKFPTEKTEMITNVPPLSFSLDKPRAKRTGPLKLIYIGAVAERRGVLKVVEALDLLRNQDVQLHIIGTVSEDRFQRVFDADQRIICHGRIPWLEARQEMCSGDVGLMLFQPSPAHNSFTGEGNTKLFEFMGLGLAVLHSELPNLSRFVKTTGAGMAVDSTSPEQIASAIDRLNDDRELCWSLGERGRQAVRENYCWEKEKEKLLDLYRRLLSKEEQVIGR